MSTVLIVDDYPSARKGLRSLLEKLCPVVCIEAVNGLDAIAKAEVARPDLIILDLSMPEMDGFEAATIHEEGNLRFRLTTTATSNRKRHRWEYAPCFLSTRASGHS